MIPIHLDHGIVGMIIKKRQEKQVSSARQVITSSLTTPVRNSPQRSSSPDSGSSSSGKDKDRLRLMSLEMSCRMRRLDSPALYRRRTLAMTQVTQLPD